MGRTNTIAGFLAGLFLSLSGSRRAATAEDARRLEFSSSTQRLGLRFTERIRDVFRFKWIKKI